MTANTPETKLVLPIIHLNGDTKQTLLDNLETLYAALREADRALCQCAPNGRNYYLVPGLLQQAQEQHRRRQTALAALIREIEAEAEAISMGDHGR